MLKKFIALLICLAMVAGISAAVSADEITEVKPVVKTFGDTESTGYNTVFQNASASCKEFSYDNENKQLYLELNGALYLRFVSGTLKSGKTVTMEWEWKAVDSEITGVMFTSASKFGGWSKYDEGSQVSFTKQYSEKTYTVPADKWEKHTITLHADDIWNDAATATISSTTPRLQFGTGSSGKLYIRNARIIETTDDVTFDAISISGYNASLAIGETATLVTDGMKNGAKVSTVDNSRLSFESDAPGVVSVDSAGVLTAAGFGTANITVDFAEYGLSETFEVSVPEIKPDIRELTFNPNDYTSVIRNDWTFRGLTKEWGYRCVYRNTRSRCGTL